MQWSKEDGGKFSDGMKVKCTPEHLFLTTKGWRSAVDLKKNSRILSSLTGSLTTLMDLCIAYGQTRDTFLKAEKDYIEQFGKLLSAQYQQIVTYITKTMIPITTVSGISSVYQKKSILNFLDQITRDFQLLQEMVQKNGTPLKRVDYGTPEWHSEQSHGPNGSENRKNAFTVNKPLMLLYEEMAMSKNFATQTAKHLIIGNVKRLKEKSDVYCINVPDIHHFSLANGAVVHNSHMCDAMRYLCISLSKTRDGLTPEELEKRYQEAVLGPNAHLPSIFRDDLPRY